MSLLDNLKAHAKELQLIPCSDGAFTLKENTIFVHSSRAPLSEATRFIAEIQDNNPNETVCILWGMGLGYHAEILLNKGFRVIGIELRPNCVRALKRCFPLERLEAFLTDQPEKDIFSVIASLSPEYTQKFSDLVMRNCHPNSFTLELLGKAKHALLSSNRIYSHLMDSWYHHILINLSHSDILSRYPKTLFNDIPVIICSAGPSLKESLPYLRQIRSKVALIAVDTALHTLIEANIIPDFVHAVDAKIHNISDFACISDSNFAQMRLLADVSLSPIVVQKPWKCVEFLYTAHPIFHPKKGFYLKSIELLNFLTKQADLLCGVQTGGSVATSAFHYAVLHSAKTIYLVGQDLAYSGYRGHSVGSPYDREYRCQTSRLNSIDHIHFSKIPLDAVQVLGIRDKVWTDPLFSQFRSWFETSLEDAQNSNLKNICINASEDGVLFEHWNHRALSTCCALLEKENDVILQKEQEISNYYRQIIFNNLFLWYNITLEEFIQNPLQREYLYREYLQYLKKEAINRDSFKRKCTRIDRVIEKIKGGSL